MVGSDTSSQLYNVSGLKIVSSVGIKIVAPELSAVNISLSIGSCETPDNKVNLSPALILAKLATLLWRPLYLLG